MRFRHVINPLGEIPEGSDLRIAQPVTLESLRRAQARAVESGIEVEVVASVFPEEVGVVPSWMEAAPVLTTDSTQDGSFEDRRRLPLFREVLGALKQADGVAPADYLIYSNIDIGVQEHFYRRVAELLETHRCGSMSITRRTISDRYTGVAQLEEMQADPGESHPGDDCFVFRAAAFSRFDIPDVYTGAAWFDKCLRVNCCIHAPAFVHLREEHLTFHIGHDAKWLNPAAKPICLANKALLKALIDRVERTHGRARYNPDLWRGIGAIYKGLGYDNNPSLPEKLRSILLRRASQAARLLRRES